MESAINSSGCIDLNTNVLCNSKNGCKWSPDRFSTIFTIEIPPANGTSIQEVQYLKATAKEPEVETTSEVQQLWTLANTFPLDPLYITFTENIQCAKSGELCSVGPPALYCTQSLACPVYSNTKYVLHNSLTGENVTWIPGNDTTATGNDNTTIGNDNTTIGNDNTTIGNDNTTIGNDNKTIGNLNPINSVQKNSVETLQDALAQLFQPAPKVTLDTVLPRSWVVEFLSEQDQLAIQLLNNPPHMRLTRHRHTVQQLAIRGTTKFTGAFKLGAMRPHTGNKPGLYFLNNGNLLLSELKQNTSATMIERLIFEDFGYQFVSVCVACGANGLAPCSDSNILVAWNITLASVLAEYEPTEFELVPQWFSNSTLGYDACEGCDGFAFSMCSNCAPLDGVDPGVSLVYLRKGIGLNGYFRAKICNFENQLPGVVVREEVIGESQLKLHFAYKLDSAMNVSAVTHIRLLGNILEVVATDSPLAASSYSLTVKSDPLPYFNKTWIEESGTGYPAYLGTWSFSPPLASNISSKELTSAISSMYPSATVNVTNRVFNPREGIASWNVSFMEILNTDVLVSLDEYPNSPTEIFAILPPNYTLINAVTEQHASVGLGGQFRIGFAGYKGNSSMYDIFLNSGFTFSSGCFQVKTGIRVARCEPWRERTCVCFSDLIPVDASAAMMAFSINQLANVFDDSIKVGSSRTSIPSQSSWTVTFGPVALQNGVGGLPANVPSLVVVDQLYMSGLGSQAIWTTLVQGNGSLYESNETTYVAFQNESTVSPACKLDIAMRNAWISTLGLAEKTSTIPDQLTALEDLDFNMELCSNVLEFPNSIVNETLTAKEVCERIAYLRYQGNENITSNYLMKPGNFCVWRELPYVVPSDLSELVQSSAVDRFNWEESNYEGVSGMVAYSQCTVPLMYKSQQLLRVFNLTDYFKKNFNESGNNETGIIVEIGANTNASTYLSAHLRQWNLCFNFIPATINIPTTEYFEVFLYIIIASVSVTSTAYMVSGLMLLQLMGKGLGSPWKKGKVVFSFFLYGFLFGVFIGMFPAAICVLIFRSIPQILTKPSAISIGIGIGTLLCYFDVGRTMRAKPRSRRSWNN